MARTRLGRAGLVAMVATLCVPIAVGAGENSGLGWQLVFVVAALLLAAGLWASRTRRVRASRAAGPGAPLPRRYWLAWWLIVLVVSVEFALVFWASTLVERRVGISLADATLVATGFYAGMATARVGLSFPFAGRRDPFLVIRAAMLVALTGSLLAWAAENVVTAAVGVYLAGLGTGPLYPLGISVALALVPGLQDRASARLILASGLAILVTPFVLGLGADLSSVSVAWLLVPVLCLGSLALTVPLGRARMQRTLATGVP
jgi:fucose permease